MRAVALCVASLLAWGPVFAQAAHRRVVTTQSDLPRYSYSISLPASQLALADDAVIGPFLAKVQADLEKTAEQYEIQDQAYLRDALQLKLNLQVLAGENAAALDTLQNLRRMQDKPYSRRVVGLPEEAVLRARIASGMTSGNEYEREVERQFRVLVATLPWAVVGDALKEQEGRLELRTARLAVAYLQHDVDPAVARSGTVSDAAAREVIGVREYVRALEPVKPAVIRVLKEYIAANNVRKPDIWVARDITLRPTPALTPVLIGIWDSGVDATLFPGQVYSDPQSGSTSAHGLAFDRRGGASTADLEPLSEAQRTQYEDMRALFQGYNDLQNQIDSRDAAHLRNVTATTSPDEMPALVSRVQFFGQWMHGTHVAGIAVRGNPAARLVVFRFQDDLADYPFAPSMPWARKFADNFVAIGEYCREHHVRVVNVSWSDDVAEFEEWLGKSTSGVDVEKRRALAKSLFGEWRRGIETAIGRAPDTLFVVAAGNSDNDASFEASVPAALRRPNIITVGAVNQAGQATSFTSYGPTVIVYANGYQVDSVVPRGAHLRQSGTSMAAPGVVNLAAKLFALDPALTPAAAIDLIRRGCDSSADGHLSLINPKVTVGLLEGNAKALRSTAAPD
jgi:subtilisin family serine protease